MSKLVQDCFKDLSSMQRTFMRNHGMGAMVNICRGDLILPFLHAAARLWDSEVHVFRFGSQELCPTIEEFQILSGIDCSGPPIVPAQRIRFSKKLSSLCGIPPSEAQRLLNDGTLPIFDLFQRFPDTGSRDVDYNRHRKNVLLMCLLAYFLLKTPDGKDPLGILDVTERLLKDENPVPLILAETLIGLDNFKNGEHSSLSGSPILLQIWLMEHLSLISWPHSPSYTPAKYLTRCLILPCGAEDEWLEWLPVRENDRYTWRFSFLPYPPAMTVSTKGLPGVIVLGFKKATFYLPCRIQRQFGITQQLVAPSQQLLKSTDYDVKYANEYIASWGDRVLLPAESNFSTIPGEGYRESIEVDRVNRKQLHEEHSKEENKTKLKRKRD